MTLRLRVLCDGTMTEYVFDRARVTLGKAPSNDLVIHSGAVPSHQGALVLEDGSARLRFESFGSGQGAVLIRDGELVAEFEGYTESAWPVQPGDFLLLDGSGARVEIVSVEPPAASPPWRCLTIPEDQAPSALAAHALLEATLAAATSPHSVEPLLRAWTRCLDALLLPHRVAGPQPRVTRAVFSSRRPEEPFDEAWAFHAASEQPGADSEVFDVTHDPLARLGPVGAQEVRELLTSPRAVVLCALSAEQTSLFMGLGHEGGALTGVMAAELEGLDDASIQTLRDLAALPWWRAQAIASLRAQRLLAQSLNLTEENRYFLERERRHYLFKELICESPAMRAVYEQLHGMVAQDSPALILGEAGSGKELLARALHHLGPRREGIFISLHCGRLSEEAMGLELFGCVASVLSGAVASRKGIFELAGAGTVYLEEVHLLSPPLQTKLVRMIKEGEVRRIGDATGRKVNARLVVSTHHELRALVQSGKLRHDLYLLIKEHALQVPPLRQRREDLMSLARIFLKKFAARYDRLASRFDDDVQARLMAHDWPGNVRELQAFIEAAVLKAPPQAASITSRELSI